LDFGVNDTVDHYARRTPTSVAIVSADTGRETTWRELEARVSRLSGALHRRFGVRKGDRVSVLSDNDPRTF
jgi:fatty-acyl-CoA synthase